MTATLERTKMLSDIEERALRKSIATKDEFGMCSSVKIPINRVNGSKDFVLRDSLSKVNYIAETYGVRSNQFYNCITNFIMKVIHRYVPYDLVCEDILNETFIKVIIAFEGGWQEKGKDHKKIYKKAYYDPAKCKNI